MEITISGKLLTDQETQTFRSLIWSQFDHVSASIPAAILMKSPDLDDIRRYRRLLFQLIEGIDGIKFPTSTASLVKIGDAYLTNLHIGAVITAFSSVLDFCKDAEPKMTDLEEIDKIQIVKKFASSILYSIIPEEIILAAKPA